MNNSTKLVDAQYNIINPAGTILPYDDYAEGRTISGMFVLSDDKNTGYSIVGPIIYNYSSIATTATTTPTVLNALLPTTPTTPPKTENAVAMHRCSTHLS